jgi:hypothetical protein
VSVHLAYNISGLVGRLQVRKVDPTLAVSQPRGMASAKDDNTILPPFIYHFRWRE